MRFNVTDYQAALRVQAPLRWHRHPGSFVHFLLKSALERVDDQVRRSLLEPRVPEPSPHRILKAGSAAPAGLIPVLVRTGAEPAGMLAQGDRLELRVRRFGLADRRVDQCIIDALEEPHESLIAESIGRLGPRERAVEVDDQATAHTRVTLRFVTPAHVQSAGEVHEQAGFSTIASSVRRRLEAICALHGELPADASERFRELRSLAAAVICPRSTLRRERWWRDTSSPGGARKRHRMVGLLGEVDFEGPIGPFVGTLAAAEVIHVGKMTSMGLGRVEVSLERDADAAEER